jgi:hypothetical protein
MGGKLRALWIASDSGLQVATPSYGPFARQIEASGTQLLCFDTFTELFFSDVETMDDGLTVAESGEAYYIEYSSGDCHS